MTLPQLAMLVGIFANLSITVVIAFKSGQKVRQVDEHERRLGAAEVQIEKQSDRISDAHQKITKLEGEVSVLHTRTAK